MEIREFQHNEDDEFFWSKMGRFFASPKVRNAVGGFMTSGPAFTWWVAFDDNNNVIGFCAAKSEKGGKQAYLTYAYTLPEHRGTGVYSALFSARMEACLQWPGLQRTYAVCSKASIGMLKAQGFTENGNRGTFVIVEKLLEAQ